MLLTKARNTLTRELGVVVRHDASGKPAPDSGYLSQTITAASVAVAVERVGTACSLPGSRPTRSSITSKPAAVAGSPAIRSTPGIVAYHRASTSAPGDGGARAGRRSQIWSAGASGTSARTQRRRHPAHPAGEVPQQRPRLGAPEVPP